ncbi:PolC-type DNA polymerase III [Mycoplasmopsis felis]|uniref:PolC-type DNA polymerase III n=1 Tax=Mycoplasmopsis felis TaxID=33923 RepID=UPI002AFE48C7|nr:PolC-type DNA polymerase III [Mycoplasmopsis felis]WQQ10520.1 PolC-type DNA polymerase III [Mycoplasmopsis felis]
MSYYKDKSFANFAYELNIGNMDAFHDAYIVYMKEIKNNDSDKIIEVEICIQTAPLFKDFNRLQKTIKFKKNYRVYFQVKDYVIDLPMFKDYILNIIRIKKEESNKWINLFDFLNKNPLNLYAKHETQEWFITYSDLNLQDEILEATEVITRNMHKMGFLRFKLLSEYQEQRRVLIQEENWNKIYQELKNKEEKIEIRQPKNFKSKSKTYSKINLYQINNLNKNQEYHYISFDGYIYKKEISENTNNNTIIYRFGITDLKEAIQTVLYLNKDEPLKENLEIDDYINVSGRLRFTSFNGEIKGSLTIDSIQKLENPIVKRTDENDLKRIELNVKSKMNALDSIFNVADIIKTAKNFGHKAVGILDSNSVQSFPEFYSLAKKHNIKPIYGSVFDFIHQNNRIILNKDFDKSKNLFDSEYVVFDIETTSLSPKLGEIIEFGATVISKGQKINSYQFFIKSKEKLSEFTQKLTNITQDMLDKDGLELIDGLNKIYDILNNKIAVAHNANFDMHFIIQKFIENNMKLPKTVFLDSLMISRILFSEKNKHSLGDFCKYLDVSYDSDVAHRADYDAEVLSKAFHKSIIMFNNAGIQNFDQLYNFLPNPELFYKRVRSINNQYSIIALNQNGLKELFELVSLTLTKRMFGSPKLFYEDIKKTNNILIGSSGLKGNLLDALFYSSDLGIQQALEKCDYVEIPHIDALKHYYTKSEFTKEQVQKLIKELIDLSIKNNKIVIGISDARYKNKEDQIFYKSLVYTKGLGGSRHFLLRTKNSEAEKQNNEDETEKDKVKKLDLTVIPDLYYLNTQEMLEGFEYIENDKLIQDIVINNTNKIVDMVQDDIVVIKDKLYTPNFDQSKTKLKKLVYDTAIQKYGEKLPEIIEQRIKKELDPILKYDFDVIYWISHILVKKSLDNGYLVGSRGSVGSSLVATLAGITEVNPLPPHYICSNCKFFELVKNPPTTSGFDLDDKSCPNCNMIMDKDGNSIPFETFLGFNADKVPDIDLNFSGEYQKIIHDEIKRIFGSDHTFRAGTISTVKSKTGFGYIKKMCEEFNFNYSNDFIDFLSTKLEDVKRTTGQHPGGIIIIPQNFSVEDFSPVNFPADDKDLDWQTTHFDYRAIHDNVIKFDILGHIDPTAIKMLENFTGLNVKKDIPKKDPRVMSLFSSTKELNISPEQIGNEKTGALGIPEFGTAFVRKMLEEAEPQSFADLISLSGLSHGTDVWKGNAQDLIKENGMKLNEVISCRDDIMNYLIHLDVDPLYSFNIMEKVRKGKGLTTEEEEFLRSKKVPEWAIKSMKLIKYMFPKAHATAYVLMAWRIAWFKLYKPLEYYATFFSTRVEEFDLEIMVNDKYCHKINQKLNELNKLKNPKANEKDLITCLEVARELYARGFKISNITLEKSLAKDWIIDKENNSLIPPFTSIKNLGISAAEKLIIARQERPFRSKEDFKSRSGINQTLYNKLKEMGILNNLTDTDQMTLF